MNKGRGKVDPKTREEPACTRHRHFIFSRAVAGSYTCTVTYYDVKIEKECAAGVRVYGVSSCATGSRSVRERPNLPPKLALCIQQPA
jgi:hypothetical protein